MIEFIRRRLGFSAPLTLSQREALQGFLYISPWIFGFLIFTVGPMIASGYLSLTDYNIVTEPRFAGFSNYEYMFEDRLFWKSVENTLYYTVIFVPISIVCSLGLAMLLNQKIRGRIALRTLYFLPSITPVVATAFFVGLDLPAHHRATIQASDYHHGPNRFSGHLERLFWSVDLSQFAGEIYPVPGLGELQASGHRRRSGDRAPAHGGIDGHDSAQHLDLCAFAALVYPGCGILFGQQVATLQSTSQENRR